MPNRNRFLSCLSDYSRELLLSRSTPVDLPIRTSLFEAEQVPSYAFFMTSGMASIVASIDDGGTVEVGVVGVEGLIGGIHLLGPAKVSTSSFMQIAGTALKVPFAVLRKELSRIGRDPRSYFGVLSGAVVDGHSDCSMQSSS
jgi:CRP-like cAMP-binding protein